MPPENFHFKGTIPRKSGGSWAIRVNTTGEWKGASGILTRCVERTGADAMNKLEDTIIVLLLKAILEEKEDEETDGCVKGCVNWADG